MKKIFIFLNSNILNKKSNQINMPKIYEYFGLIFFFYSNEHLPIHVHVSKAESEMKFDLVYEVGKLLRIDIKKISGKETLSKNDINDAIELIKTHHEDICRKWTDFFVMGKQISVEKISKKI